MSVVDVDNGELTDHEAEQGSKQSDFIKVFQQAVRRISVDNRLTSGEKVMFLFMLTALDFRNVLPAQRVVVQQLRTYPYRVSVAYAKFVRLGLIRRLSKTDYVLNPFIAWKGTENLLEIARDEHLKQLPVLKQIR